MKYTDKEYAEALNELYELIEDIQSAEQTVYQGPLDTALSEASNVIADEIYKYEEGMK